MSTSPAPASMSTEQWLLLILNAALAGLAAADPAVGTEALAFTKIIQAAMNAYSQETGKPLDLTQIPPETPLS